MYSLARHLIYALIVLSTARVTASPILIRPEPVGDTILLPYGMTQLAGSEAEAIRKPIIHTIRILRQGIDPSDTVLAVEVFNSPYYADDAASVFVNALLRNLSLSQDPIFLTITDFTLFRDRTAERDAVAITGYRNDTAYVARNFPGTNRFNLIFLATGSDQTGNGQWEPCPFHLADFDYDHDGTREMFVYLMCGRDKSPRALYCIDPDRWQIEWELPMASPATFGNTADCHDSSDPGILVVGYGTENGVTDTLFDDRLGYLTRIDRQGHIVFSRKISGKFTTTALRTLPGDSLFLLLHQYPLSGQTGDSTSQKLSIIDARTFARTSLVAPFDIASVAIADISGDTTLEILAIGSNGEAMLFDCSLTPLARITGARLGPLLSILQLPGSQHKAMQFATDGGSLLYSTDWKCLGFLPGIVSEMQPATFDSSGGVSIFVANAGSGFVVGRLEARPWSARFVAVLWRFRNWFVVALALISIQLVLVNIRRRKAITQLEQAKQRNQAMLQATPDLIFRLTTDGRFLDYQASKESDLLAPGGDFIGKRVGDLLPSDIARRVMDAIAEVVATGRRLTIEYSLPMHGLTQEFEARLVLGGEQEVLAVVRNVSEQRRTARAVLESERNFRHFFETIGDLLLVASLDGRVLFWNSALRSKLGLTEAQMQVLHLVQLFPSAVRADAEHLMQEVRVRGPQSISLPLVGADGSAIAVASRFWRGQWNGTDCIFGLCEDLTEQQEAQERFQRLFEASPALMALTEESTGRFIEVNSTFLRTIGYSRHEVIGRTSTELSLFADPAQHAAVAAEFRNTGHLSDVNLSIRCKDGRILQGLFSGAVILSGQTAYLLTVMIDVTEQRRVTEALRESREFLRLVLDSTPIRVFWKDLNGVYLGCNTPFAKDAGCSSPDEIIGKDDFAMVWRQQATKYRADDRAVIESGRATLLIEEPQSTPAGGVIHLLTSKVPLRDAKGEIVGVLGSYQDITELKAAEQALRNSEEKYRALAEQANMGILLYDDQRVLYANRQLAEMLETEVETLNAISVERLISALVGEEVMPVWRDRVRTRLAGGDAPPQFEAEITTFKGTHKRIEALARRIELPDRIFIQATWLDITTRHRIEQSLRESEAKFRAVAESMTAGITIFGREKLLYCNPATTSITGYSIDELLLKNFWEIIHPDFRELVLSRGRERLDGGRVPPRYEVKIVRKDGDYRWIDYSAQVIQFQGQSCVLGTTIDITDRVSAEDELRRVYQERYQQVRTIAGGVSHEIYNSLFPATTSLHKLRERLRDRTNDPTELERDFRLLSLAEQAISRAIHMTESVTSYSRLEANRKVEAVAVAEVIAEILEQNRARCEANRIALAASSADSLRIACSRPHFYSMLNNLVVNAIDALVETEQPVLSISSEMVESMVQIRVTDNGMGILPEDLPRIFDAFFSTKPRSGTGIGLAMARKIAEMYGGTIKVTSVPRSGTSFLILMPRHAASEGATNAT